MSSEKVLVSLDDVGKCYLSYASPRDRLKQLVLPSLSKFAGLPPREYASSFWALRHISFEVRRGESIGIVGCNGSGKSTLLQLITGVLKPSEGRLDVHGRIAALLELGAGFNLDFTGRENVYLNAVLLGFSRSQVDERFDQIAAFADIGEFLDQPVRTYSSGMFVRLAFAVQVQLDPDILIVDEALAVGDSLFQKRCYQRIDRYLENGGTLIFVSHDQEVVRTLTSRSVFLDKGRCRGVGPSSEIVLDYRRHLHDVEADHIRRTSNAQPVAALKLETCEIKEAQDDFSFGDYDVVISAVEVLINGDSATSVAYPGDVITVFMTCRAAHFASRLSFGIRIRNREGVKVYSGSTFAEDVNMAQDDPERRGYWHREFQPGEVFRVGMKFVCSLGEGFYEIQAFVCEELIFMPGHQRMLHWRDEAAFFNVAMDRLKKWYGGVCDVSMSYWIESNGI